LSAVARQLCDLLAALGLVGGRLLQKQIQLLGAVYGFLVNFFEIGHVVKSLSQRAKIVFSRDELAHIFVDCDSFLLQLFEHFEVALEAIEVVFCDDLHNRNETVPALRFVHLTFR
jgi:hypothetical protein